MKVLVLHASPRKNGSTNQVMSAFLKHQPVDDLIHVYLYEQKIEYCKGCLYCANEGICFIEDDMQHLYELFETVDVIVFGSPMYFNSVSSAAKVMIDRTQQYWSRKFQLKTGVTIEKQKKGVFICTAGVSHDATTFVSAKRVVEIFFKAINATYDVEIVVDNLDHEALSVREDLLETIEAQGRCFFQEM